MTGPASESFVYHHVSTIYVTVKCMEKELNCNGLKKTKNQNHLPKNQ